MADPFIRALGIPGEVAPVFSIPIFLTGITAATASEFCQGWIPPSAALIQQLQIGAEVITAGSVTVEIAKTSIDTLGAVVVTVLATLVLDADHPSAVAILSETVGPTDAIAIVVTGSVAGLTGGSFILGSFTGTLG